MTKPNVLNQGKVIIEWDQDGFLVMLPTGDLRSFATRKDAEAFAQRYFKKTANVDALNVGRIEWRDVS